MSPATANNHHDVVEIVSSDDDEDQTPVISNPKFGRVTPSDPNFSKQKLDCRSFWQAGNYEIGPSSFAPLQGELEHARVHPKFLHSNATSHKWAFGGCRAVLTKPDAGTKLEYGNSLHLCLPETVQEPWLQKLIMFHHEDFHASLLPIAELLDNAVDEIPNGATFVKVDRIINAKDNSPALLFHDDGGGMNPDGIRKCMSLGYSSKKSNTTIGQYGNGFKTSTMRLGADAIVFTRSTKSGLATQSIGLLSYSYLRLTGQDDVIVPMVDFDISDHWAEPIIYGSLDDWTINMNTILEWSPFASKDELMMQFEDIGAHGTKVVIYNLWLNDEGIYELSFDDDDEDIKLRDETCRVTGTKKTDKRNIELQNHVSYRLRYSLRAYASVLYLREFKNFKILLRGRSVQQYNIAKDLQYAQVVSYKPQLAATSNEVTVQTTIGFMKEDLPVAGFNVYHKNRLIRPFWKVTRDGNSVGLGVVGVLEANFIEPAHDKQDFERSPLFIRLEARMKQMVMDYWKHNCHHKGYKPWVVSNLEAPPKAKKILRVERPSNRVSPAEVELSPVALSAPSRGNYQDDACDVQPRIELSPDALGDDSTDVPIDQIYEEHIKLLTRCEEHAQREQELKQTAIKLEKELEETRRKCAQMAAYLESRKKQQNLM